MRPAIVLFGDSITEEAFGEGGWSSLLANHYSRSADVVLRGYNTCWAARVAGRAACPAAATSARSPSSSAPTTPPSPTAAARPSTSPSPSTGTTSAPSARCSGGGGRPSPSSSSPERTIAAAGRYARPCVDVARRCGARAIDIWSRMQAFPGWEKSFLRDGLHLTPCGNRLVFEEVVFALRDAHLGLEALPPDLPLFADMDPDDPGKAFEE